MIRDLKMEDLNDLLILDALALHSNWHLSDYHSELLNADTLGLGLELEGKLCGFILFRQSFLDAELMQIMIHPNEQGKEYGKGLMDYAEKILKERGVEDLHLEVRDDNLKAIKFYSKFGFIDMRLRKNYYGLGRHARVMRKRLIG